MKNFKLKLLAGLIGLSSLGLAQAETATATMEVSTTVTAFCTVTAPSLAWTSFSQSTSTDFREVTGNITPVCTKGTPYSISIDGGLNVNGTTRRMKHSTSSTDYLEYSLNDNGAMPVPISTEAYAGTGDGIGGAVQNHYIAANLDYSQNVIAGDYSDTLTVTVTY